MDERERWKQRAKGQKGGDGGKVGRSVLGQRKLSEKEKAPKDQFLFPESFQRKTNTFDEETFKC